MKKILFLALTLLAATGAGTLSAQDSNPAGTTANAAVETAAPAMEQPAQTVSKAEGDSAYIRADYATAIQVYETLLQQGEAAELYYNLGNSYYKTDDIARAILNYERALLLRPGNADVRANLDIARAKTVDKVTPIPEIFFVSWFKALVNLAGADTWAAWGILFFLLLLVSLYFFFFSKQPSGKKAGFAGAIATLLLVVLCNLFASQQKGRALHRTAAIVLSPSVTVRSTPSDSGTALFILHEGHKVEIKDNTMRQWKEIRLEDGKVGWLPAEAIELI